MVNTGFWNNINKMRFISFVAFTAIYYFLIPMIPHNGVMLAASLLIAGSGLYSTAVISAFLLLLYFIIAYFWLLYSGFDKYLLKRKYNRP